MVLSVLVYFAFLLKTAALGRQSSEPLGKADSARQTSCYSGTFTYNLDQAGTATSLSYDGKITFTDDERDIRSITPGGYFRFSKTTFGHKREIFIQSGSTGTLHRKYYVGKAEAPYEPEGRQWLQEMLPEIIATTGLGAEDRIRRIYARAGIQGVLTEIGRIESNYARTTYYSHLFAFPGLKDQDLKGVLTHLGHHLDSDHEKSKLLRQVAPRYLQSGRHVPEFLAAVATLSSDYEKAKVLTAVLQAPQLNQANCEMVLPAVAHIDSDYEQAKVLRAALAKPELSPRAHKEVIQLSRAIESDYEKNRVLLVLIANPRYVTTNFGELLESINTIDSDYEKSRAIANLVGRQKLTPRQYLQLFPVVAALDANYDKSRTLQKIRAHMPADNAEVRAAYVRTAKTITSDHEYRKAIAGLD